MNAFSKLHPFTIFCYYVITLILLIWVGHPMLYLMMFVLMFADYSLSVGGRRGGQGLSFQHLCGIVLRCDKSPSQSSRCDDTFSAW